ncbi:hypothetical protein [Campylobacter phage CJLB-12]|nr:hypothetical protein [Campylobacter phage CJLB-12]
MDVPRNASELGTSVKIFILFSHSIEPLFQVTVPGCIHIGKPINIFFVLSKNSRAELPL